MIRLGLTPLQGKVLDFYSASTAEKPTHAGGGDAGWNTSARALIRRKMLRWASEDHLHITELGLKALRFHKASWPA